MDNAAQNDVPATFLGVPAAEQQVLSGIDIAIFGASEATPHLPGQASHAAHAPSALRACTRSIASDPLRWDFDQDGPLLSPALRVVDLGDLPTSPATPLENRALITATTSSILTAGAVPVLLGGDDSVPIPFFAGFESCGPLTIVQIDAHLDWRDERSGLKHTFSSTMRRASEMPWVERIIQVGQRGIGGSRAVDLAAARAWGAGLFSAASVRRHGIEPILEQITPGSRCIITVDCDGLDPAVIPAVLVPQPGGLGYLDIVELLHGVAGRARIVGFDLVELVPEADVRVSASSPHPAFSAWRWGASEASSPHQGMPPERDRSGVGLEGRKRPGIGLRSRRRIGAEARRLQSQPHQ